MEVQFTRNVARVRCKAWDVLGRLYCEVMLVRDQRRDSITVGWEVAQAAAWQGTPGKQLDSPRGRGKTFDFQLGAGRVIQGWDKGLEGLCVGAKAVLTIPRLHLTFYDFDTGLSQLDGAQRRALWLGDHLRARVRDERLGLVACLRDGHAMAIPWMGMR